MAMDISYLVMTISSPWFFDGPNRNRWLTEFNSMVDLSAGDFFKGLVQKITKKPPETSEASGNRAALPTE
jgi:hypothetical protein